MKTETRRPGRKTIRIDREKHPKATRLQEFRQMRGLTQQEIAQHLGVTTCAIYNAERRQSALDLHRWIQLADLLEVDFRALLGFPTADQKNFG